MDRTARAIRRRTRSERGLGTLEILGLIAMVALLLAMIPFVREAVQEIVGAVFNRRDDAGEVTDFSQTMRGIFLVELGEIKRDPISKMDEVKQLTEAGIPFGFEGNDLAAAFSNDVFIDFHPYGDARADRIGQDMYECEALAHQASRVGEESVKGALVGGGIGMVGGVLLGAITGRPVQGAMIGATAGGVAGGASQGMNADQRFVHAYRNCMINRGHNVID